MDRNLEYEKCFRSYIFKGDIERARSIFANLNVKGVGLNEFG